MNRVPLWVELVATLAGVAAFVLVARALTRTGPRTAHVVVSATGEVLASGPATRPPFAQAPAAA